MAILTELLLPTLNLSHKYIKTVLYAGVIILSFLPVTLQTATVYDVKGLTTVYDKYGICLQTTDYTCGPAATVTALKQFGIKVDEAELAIGVQTKYHLGSTVLDVYQYLVNTYPQLKYEVVHSSIEQLKKPGVYIIGEKVGTLQYHCITILRYEDGCFIVGDPALGLQYISDEAMQKSWVGVGIKITK
jgi:ABC-type bacteriocin/lantibiotic exporter with double-glycine peptidase domain